jgi:hypothetical protein
MNYRPSALAIAALTASSLALVHCGKDDETAVISYDLASDASGNYAFTATKSGAATDLTLTLSNGGKGPASNLAMELTATAANSDDTQPFVFKGGAYPGTGGTCTTSLGKGESCTVVISFAPVTAAYSSADYVGALAIGFNDGKNSQSKTFNLSGTGSLCNAGSEVVVSHTTINVGGASSTQSTATRFAQSFTLSADKDIKSIQLSQYHGTSAFVSGVNVSIHADQSGHPAATALATYSGNPTILSSQRSWISYTMPTPVGATAGSTYWIVVGYDMTSADYTYIDTTSTNYADGSYQYSQNSGSSWTGGAADLAFKVETCN